MKQGFSPKANAVRLCFCLCIGLVLATGIGVSAAAEQAAVQIGNGDVGTNDQIYKDVLNADELYLLTHMNHARAAAGLPALVLDMRLVQLARDKAAEMMTLGYFSHYSPTAGSVYDVLEAAGIPYRWVGENIGRGGNVGPIHEALMDSPGHRANMMASIYTHVGVGAVSNGRQVSVVQIFMKPL